MKKESLKSFAFMCAGVLAFVLACVYSCNAQTIVYVDVRIAGDVQDISSTSNIALENVSLVRMSDGTTHTATESDPIEWEHYRVLESDSILIDSTFQVYPGAHMDVLCHGKQLFLTRAIVAGCNPFRQFYPVKILFNPVQAACPQINTPWSVGSLSWNDEEWFKASQKIMLYYNGFQIPEDETGQPVSGDLNADGTVNTADLLLFLTAFGN